MNENTQVLLEKRDGAATITMNRPEALNTMTASFLEELLAAVEDVAGDGNIRVLVLRGAGRAFCAGGDLKAGVGGAVAGDPPLMAQTGRLRNFMRIGQLLRSMPAVTVAAVHGACAGAGLSIACATDLRLAQEDAKFASAFLTAGLSGDFGGTWLLPRIIGSGRAREIYLRALPFDAAHAYSIGLVAEVVPDVFAAAEALASELLARPPLALARLKANLNEAEEISFGELLDREAERHQASVASKDAVEATAAFLEKRPAVFTGK